MFAPDASAPLIAWVRLLIVLPVLLFIPGYLVGARMRSPFPLVTAFIASALLCLYSILVTDAIGVRFTLGSLAGGLGFAAVAGWLIAKRPSLRVLMRPFRACAHPINPWKQRWLIPCIIGFGSVVVRAFVDPLSGFDNLFRWNHLSLVMAAQGSLGHYPPVSAADFRVFPWCDGIPPLVPVMNLVIYLAGGSTAKALTAARITLEIGFTLGLVWYLAGRIWGRRGAQLALVSLAGSCVFLWSVAMGQETGLSGVALLALAALCFEYQRLPISSTAAWAGVAAGMAALCREYNLLYLPAAAGALWLCGAKPRHIWLALIVASAVAAPWYLRNTVITGNPLYPQSFGGLFPTNHVHEQAMRGIQAQQGLTVSSGRPLILLPVLGLGLGGLLLLALPGLWPTRQASRVLALLWACNAGLWLTSISSTAGSWVYSLRVLGTGLPLLAVAAGWWGQYLSKTAAGLIAVSLALLCTDAARRSWTFVWQPLLPAWPYNWHYWSHIKYLREEQRLPELWAQLSRVAAGESIIAEHPNFQIDGLHAGAVMISPCSQEAAALTDLSADKDLPAIVTELRQRHVRFVVLIERNGNPSLLPFRGFDLLYASPPSLSLAGMRVYDLAKLATTSSRIAPQRRGAIDSTPFTIPKCDPVR